MLGIYLLESKFRIGQNYVYKTKLRVRIKIRRYLAFGFPFGSQLPLSIVCSLVADQSMYLQSRGNIDSDQQAHGAGF